MQINIMELVCSKKLLFVTGKGGIGKSLMATAIALQAHKDGKKVLLVQQAASDHLGPLLGVTNVGHDAVTVRDGFQVANFNAGGNFRDFIIKHLKHGSLFESLASSKLIHGFFTAIPGFAELMLLGRLYYTLQLAPQKPDLVVVDSYATGHFMSLMTTPQAVMQSGLAGPIMAETKRVMEFLRDRRLCGTVIVGVPEELVITEMAELIPALHRKSPVDVSGVIFNRNFSENAGKCDAGVDDSAARKFLRQRLDQQTAAWQVWQQRVQELGLQSLPVFKVPELGFIDEPLSDDVVQRLLDSTQETT